MTDEPTQPSGPRAPAVGMVLPPPAFPALMILGGWLIHTIYPIPLARDTVTAVSAALSAIAALSFIIGAAVTLRRVRTPIEPWKATRELVTSGVFSISRNPVYLGFLFGQASVGWGVGIGWILFLLPVTWVLLDRLQVRREEAYLLTLFGDEYRAYGLRVRRWV